jgi:hypothetical protein
MSAQVQVKPPFPRLAVFLGLLLASAGILPAAEPPPDARAILRDVRASQALHHEALNGRLRNGASVIPFRIVFGGETVKYEFTNPAATIVLRLDEKDSKLSEVTKGGAERISGARFSDAVRGSDLSYEDLSMRFLYWSKAAVQGEELKLFRKCWVVRVEPPQVTDSQYSKVVLWVDKDSGALMQAEAFDRLGKFARRFKVISGQKIDGAWYLKQMRIEAPAGANKDKTPTHLEIEGVDHSGAQ